MSRGSEDRLLIAVILFIVCLLFGMTIRTLNG